jgi:hypothetical protein
VCLGVGVGCVCLGGLCLGLVLFLGVLMGGWSGGRVCLGGWVSPSRLAFGVGRVCV